MRSIEIVNRYAKAFKEADPYAYYLDSEAKKLMIASVAAMTKEQKAMLEQLIELVEQYQD